MPLVTIALDRLRRLVGKDLGRDELLTALERLGNDVEGYSTVTRHRCARCGHVTEALEHEDFGGACDFCGDHELAVAGSAEVVRITLLPVRPDMFDAAGLARCLRGYLGIETGLARYRPAASGFKVTVAPGLEGIRPYIAAAVMRGLPMDDENVRAIMKMQENLHWALGRDRRRASIGVYDLDTVKPDFVYKPVAPEGVKFIPLLSHLMAPAPGAQSGMPEGMKPATPAEILKRHPKGTAYQHLLAPFAQYPLLCDASGKVLSMPPIINSEETRVTPATKNLFVDVTGPDRNAVARTLAVIACGLADLGAQVETVTVSYPDGREETTPDLEPLAATLDPAAARRVLGCEISAEEMVSALERMRYDARLSGGRIDLAVPAYRSDIMHEYDIIEDVGIGYGYHNIKPRLVPTMTVGRHQRVEDLSEVGRRALVGLGYLEIMTLVLTHEREHYQLLRLDVPPRHARIENPASVEQTMPREHLLSGILATFRVNTAKEMPQLVFEAGDCFAVDEAAETGVRARRLLAAGMAGPRAGFADAKAVVEALGRELGRQLKFETLDHPAFISGRCARVRFCLHPSLSHRTAPAQEAQSDIRDSTFPEWGVLGEVHPVVLEGFGITQPVALLEVDLTAIAQEV